LRLIFLSVTWLAGIYLGSKIALPPAFCLAALVPLLWLIFRRRNLRAILLAAIGIFLFTAAAVYSYGSLYHVDDATLRFYNDTGATELKATVSADPDVRDKSARLTLSAAEIYTRNTWHKVGGKVLAVVARYPEYHYGDVLHLTGDLVTPVSSDNFDYQGYLSHQGIYSEMTFPQIEVIGQGQGFPPLSWIYHLRAGLSRTLARLLPEPQAALAQGILLGIRSGIPASLTTDFSRSGTSHLLAISGQNIAIMAGILLGVGLALFGRRRYLYVWLALVAVWFYTVITGFTPPVVRGAVMATVFLVAEALGRQKSGAAALTLAAAVMVGLRPYILGDASFQLSFAAMAGLIFIYPVLRDYGRKIISAQLGEQGFVVAAANLVVDTLSASLGSIIAVWPLIAYYFGLFSLVGPLATLVLTPALTVIIVLGSLAGVAGLVSLVVGQFFSWLLWPFLSYMILVVEWLGSPAVSSVKVAWLNPAFIIVYYLALAALMTLHNRWTRAKSLAAGSSGLMRTGFSLPSGSTAKLKWLLLPAALIAVVVVYAAVKMPGNDLRVSFLDVGQGDAILIQFGSRQVLVDGGPSPQAVMLALSKEMPFWDRTIDVVVLTHPHEDHLGGLLEVLKRYRVKQVLSPAFASSSQLYQAWVGLIGEGGVKSSYACAGMRIDLGKGVFLDILNPSETLVSGTGSDIDNNSVVLRLTDGSVSFLLTGDMMSEAEHGLLYNRLIGTCTVLKVAHHGSDSSSTLAFLSVIKPQYAVIEVGPDNDYGLPKPDVIARVKDETGEDNLYLTRDNGTVTFTTDGQKLWVKTEK
jgi:competence protein ComEC